MRLVGDETTNPALDAGDVAVARAFRLDMLDVSFERFGDGH